jgi:hypothetical protein
VPDSGVVRENAYEAGGIDVDNEQIVRQAYKIAEDVDIEGWLAAFTEAGTFTDESIGVTYQ